MIPKHIAFILDGNRRWARERGVPRIMGHTKGYERIQDIVKHGKKRGITHMTFWAFSTENWNRSEKEVTDLMQIFRKLFTLGSLDTIIQEGARIQVFGDMSRFPKDIQKNVSEVLLETQQNTTIFVNIALNYGGRDEILRGIQTLLAEGKKAITEYEFSNYLYTKGQPDPDLVIRTGGEKRLSGYLSWQTVYSELYFTDTFWPDFGEKEFDLALEDFQTRQRRFGK